MGDRGIFMGSLREGEKFQSLFTGKIYRIKAIKDQMVLLESIDGLSQVLTHRENLRLFYTKILHPEDARYDLEGNGPFPLQEKDL